ncbi:unnamed protein product [Cunninghamella blakesleeana]
MQYDNNQYYTLGNQLTEQFYAGEQPTELPQIYTNENVLMTPTPTTPTTNKKSNDKNKKTKRKQVKNACINCQKACKKCDEGRACQRCIKLGIADTCVDSPRKERLKGVKRGPYKKRQKQNVPALNNNTNMYHPSSSPFKYEQSSIKYESFEESPLMWHPAPSTNSNTMIPSPSYQTSSPLSSTMPTPHLMDNTMMYQQQESFMPTSTDSLLSSPIHSLNDPYYSSPLVSSTSSTTSPESTTMILPQDTLPTFALDEMSYPLQPTQNTNLMMMMPLQLDNNNTNTNNDDWSSLSSSPIDQQPPFIPQLSQPIYQQQQQQYYYQPKLQQQQPTQQMMYFDASSVEWLNPNMVPTQLYM